MSETARLEDEVIDLRKVASFFFKFKLVIFFCIMLCGVVGYFVSDIIPKKYTSFTVLMPNESNENGLSGLTGQLGGFASLAGIDLSSGGNKTQVAIETMRSFHFFSTVLNTPKLKAELFATKNWDKSENKLEFKRDLADKDGIWLLDEKGESLEFSAQKAHRLFLKNNLVIFEDKKTGFVTVKVNHYSPYVAQKVVKLLVDSLNKIMREQELKEVSQSIDYLYNQIAESNVSEIKSLLYQVIQKKVETGMLAQVQKEFVFKVIEPSKIEEKHSSPKKVILLLGFMFLGFILGSLVSLFLHKGNK